MKSIKNINMLTVVGLLWQVSIGCRDWAERGQRIADAVNSFVPGNWEPTGPTEEDILAATKIGDRAVKGSLKDKLMSAIANGDSKAVKAHIAAGASVNAQDSFRCTAFFHAADKKHVDIVKILIAAGDATDRDTFEEVFMSAVHSGNTEMVKALMVGSDRIRYDTFDTAYMLAGRKPEIRNIIKDHLANLNNSEVAD